MDISHPKYVFKFKWLITGLYLYPNVEVDFIASRPFIIPGLRNTRWRLELRFKDKDFSLTENVSLEDFGVYIRRLPYSETVCLPGCLIEDEITVDFSIQLNLLPTRRFLGKSFKELDAYGCLLKAFSYSLPPLDHIRPERTYDQAPHKFYVICSISQSYEKIPGNYNEDIMTLSKHLGLLQGMADRCDIVDYSVEPEHRVAHTNIIACRAENFLTYFENDPAHSLARKNNAFSMPGDMLQTILTFIYTGVLNIPLSRVPKKLFHYVVMYSLQDLKRKLYTQPNAISLHTEISYERKSVGWCLDFKKTVFGNKFVSKMPVYSLYCDEIVLTCEFIGTSPEDQAIEICVEVVGFNKDIPIFFELTVLLEKFSEACQTTHHHERLYFLKTCDDDFSVMYEISSDTIQLDVKFDLLICDGGKISSLPNECRETENKRIYDFEKLSLDMFRMWKEEKHYDIRIICDEEVFKVHKNILFARCKRFEEFVTDFLPADESSSENLPTEVRSFRFDEIRTSIMRLLLTYFYSGWLFNIQYEDVKKLYVMAKGLAMPALLSKCHEYFKMFISNENKNEISGLAQMVMDNTLQVFCATWSPAVE